MHGSFPTALREALKTRKNGGGPPEQALRFFEQLYRIEKQARDKTPDAGETKAACIRRFRQQHGLPVLNALKSWPYGACKHAPVG
jgi:transposase